MQDKQNLESEPMLEEYQKMYDAFKDIIDNYDKRLIDMECAFNDSNRAYAGGLQNVYEKFKELESKQDEVIELLNSDYVKKFIERLPSRASITDLLVSMEKTDISKMDNSLNELRADFEDFRSLFNF